MVATRPPLQVEVVTKIPVSNGLPGLSNPGVTSGLATAQSTAARAAVEVVTDVPGQLRNVTPLTLGQKFATVGKIGVNIGSKVVGTGLGVLGNLAQDLFFPEPVGLGSDMVGGIKIGSQPQTAPTAPVITTQAIAKPQVTAQPFKPPAPVVAPVAAPPKPKATTQTQPQVETQPLPTLTTTQPQSVPTQTRPQPQPIAIPTPRSALETPTPMRTKPELTTESPFPLNLVDLNSYGGVNLTYPIAQAILKLPNKITEALQPGLDIIESNITEQLNKIPQTFEEILKNSRIETSTIVPVTTALTSAIPFAVNLSKDIPVTTDLTAQIPLTTDLTSQIPVSTNLNSQIPLNVDLNSQIPLALGLTSQLPLNVDLASQIPLSTDLTSQIPLAVGLTSAIPFALNFSKDIPVTTDLTAQIPFTLNLSKEIPATTDLTAQIPFQIDLSKEIPLSLGISATLQPDTEANGLSDLQKCCESIQKTLAKEAAIIEGRGELYCDGNTVPYSYRGEGLKGIHQLIQIILGANKQILEKVCTLDIEYPLIAGSGVYQCGTLAPTLYNYSGLGFVGIQNQIDQLFGLEKTILNEVCEISTSPSGSFPNISGAIEYFNCDYTTQAILYSGNGFEGLSKQVDALSTLVKVGVKASCDSMSTVIMPDARFEEFRPTRQLMITWGTQYPSRNGSMWHTYLPDPIAGLEWCKDFENLVTTKGNIYGRVRWENSKIPTGIYGDTEEEVKRILRLLVMLSNALPTLDEEGLPQIVIQKGHSIKRKSVERAVRAVRAAISEIGADGNPTSVLCLVPPIEGCLPTII